MCTDIKEVVFCEGNKVVGTDRKQGTYFSVNPSVSFEFTCILT